MSRITTAQKIKELNDRFKNSETFSIGELYMYYKEFDNSLTMNSVRVRIARFVKSGILKKLGGGIYTFEKKEGYFPEVNNKLKALYKKLNKKFPLLKFCVWHTSALNEFMQHQPFRFYTIIETEEDGLESVFDFLRRQIPNLFLIPDQNTLYRYTSEKNDSAVIINLVSEAPIMEINGVPTISLEKMLVDMVIDKVIFAPQQGNELLTIFKTAFEKYPLNKNRLLRYANRRGKKEEIANFINKFTNILT